MRRECFVVQLTGKEHRHKLNCLRGMTGVASEDSPRERDRTGYLALESRSQVGRRASREQGERERNFRRRGPGGWSCWAGG